MEDNDVDRGDWHAPVSEGELAEDAGQNIDFASQSSAIEASLMLPPNHNREDEFINMLFTVEGDRMSNAVFLFFFDLLEDEAYNLAYQKRKQFPTSTAPSQAQGTGPIQSINVELDMFYIFLTLFLRSERELQIFGLTKLNELAESNVLVKQYCAERRWIIQLLLALPKLQDSSVLSYLFQFIERLAVYNITTLDIKFIFKLFQHELPYFQEYYWTHAFKLLQRIWSFSDGPTSFFNFPGQGSGMIMPGIPKFPNNGYTFMCWINVDAFGNVDAASKTEFTPYLYSLTTEEGLGFSAYFVKGKLNFGIMHKKDQVNVEPTNYQFLPRTWYFIAVTHSHNILRKSEAQLFVNGQSVQTFQLSYPKTDKPYVRCNFGISSKPERGNNVIRAQVAGFAFFEDLLAEQDIAGLFKHGPNLFSLHGPLEEMIQPKSGISLFKSKPKLIYMFTPKATEAHWCIEPITRDESKRAVKLTGVKEYHVTLLEQSLFSIGGIQVLLPLFSNEHRPKLSEIRDLNIQIINLISELVKDNEYYLNEMYRTQFFEIMGLLLSDQTFAKYNKWSPPAIIALERLSNAINSFEPLFKQFFQHIYLNYRIWISTEVAVQKLLLQSISSHIHRNPKFFHQLISIQNLMNILSDFYSYNDQMQKNFFRDNALTKNELIELRLGLLEIVHLLIKKEDFNEKECKSILLYLQQESQKPEDVRLTVDVLQLLVAAMTPKAEPVHKAIIKLNGYNVFLTLMHTNSEFIRLWTVKMLGKIMIYSPLYLSKYKSSQIQKDASAMKKYLEGYNFTDTIYCVLLEILFENISTQVIENPINHITQQMKQEVAQPSAPVSPMVKTDSKGALNVPAAIAHVGPLFKVPQMIPVIFELLCLRADYKLKIRALKDFVYLVNSSNENKITFLKQNNWQSWVFALLALDANYSIEEENNLVQLIIDLLSTLLGFCFSQKDGYKVFEETKAFMNHFSNIPRFGELSRKLNEKLLQTLSSSDKLLPQAQQTFHVWQNISHWLFFVEQFIFIAPNKKKQEQPNNSLLSMKVHHGEEGLWLDFAMAQKLLGLLDNFMRIDHKKHLVHQLQQHVENVPKTSGFASFASTISQSFSTLATGQPSANNPQQVSQQQQEVATQLNTVYEIEAGMQRLHLRLLLHSIKEAGAFRATQKIENKRTTFANIKRITQEYFSSQKIQDSLAVYLQEKAKQFTMELSDIDQVFTKNLNRVRTAIGNLLGNATLLASSNNAPVLNKVLYLVSFIYFVLRHPEYAEPELQQQLVSLFRDLVVTAKSLLVSNQAVEVRQQLSQMKEEDLVQFFVDGFNNPDSFPLSQWFSQGIVSTLAEDSAAMEKVTADINKFKLDITERMEMATMEELDNFKKLDVELKKLTENLVTEADARKRNFRIRQSQQLSQIEHKWKQMLRQLVSERGPLNSPFNLKPKERVFWKIDLTETSNRMHLKLKRHYGSTDIVLRASGINDEKEREQAILDHPASPQRNELKMAQSDLLRVRRSIEHSHDQGGDMSPIEEDWEEIPEELSAELDEEAEKKTEDSLYLKCELVKGVAALSGDLEVSGTQISFRNVDLKVFKVIAFTNLKSIYSRRYNLRNTALEFFLKDKKSYFFNFEKKTDVTTVMKKILAKKPALEEYFLGPPNKLFKAKAKLTELWRKRMISNFDYLMALNTIAGRTTNDLSQYPVFPWILSDYGSPEINLDDPTVYRDLTKPIGALEPTRLNNLIERMNAIDESEIPKFLYGSHYSSSGTVLFYLLRIEPYTTHAVTLQGGKFDFPSRMFWSISDTWKNCLINPSDVKELIPEFFYQPAFLTNVNNLNFGRKPDRQSVSEVILPPWAKTPHEFIQINRAALESEYVSENLHHWIDLIFGYKQKGEEALKAHNLFYYLTYEGQVDIDQIEDPVDRKAILDQINNFGQTPSQLLTTPHPKRMSLMEIERPLSGSGGKMNLKEMFAIRAWNFHPNYQPLVPQPPIVFLRSYQGRLWILFQDGVLTKTEYSVKQKKGPLQLETPPATLPGAPKAKNVKRIDLLSSPEMSFQLDQNKYSLSPDGQSIVMCGQWDNSFNFVKLNSLAVTPVIEHTDVVTALALDGNKLVTASMDCTCLAWDMTDVNKSVKDRKPERVFYGHDEQLTCVAVSLDLDLVATGSKDSTAILFNYTKGQYIRTLKHESEVSLIAISKWGYIVTYVRKEMALYLWSVNGELLNKIQGAGLLTSLLMDKNGQFVITAGEVGYVSVRTLHLNSLKVAFQWKVTPKVTSMTLIDEEYLAVGLDDGRLYVMLYDPLTFVDLMKKQLNIKSV